MRAGLPWWRAAHCGSARRKSAGPCLHCKFLVVLAVVDLFAQRARDSLHGGVRASPPCTHHLMSQ